MDAEHMVGIEGQLLILQGLVGNSWRSWNAVRSI